MNENDDEKEKYLINNNSLEKSKNDLSTTDDQIKKYNTFNKYLVNHKYTSTLKYKLIKDIRFFEKHSKLIATIKFLLGFILLSIPLFIIIYFIYNDYSVNSKYIFFPYFLSLSLIMGSFLIVLVIKLVDECKNYGIFILSWERANIFRILKLLTTGLFILWILFLGEDFIMNFNLLRERVAQSNNKGTSSKIFNQGTYSLKLLFILFLWDTEKNDRGDYNHDKIGYFEYEGTVFKDFHYSLSKLLIPILFLCFFYLIKIILIKTKREIIYVILYIVILSKCFYFLLSKPSKEVFSENIKKSDSDGDEEYFLNNKGKYFEIICNTIIILILIIFSFKRCILDLINKKFYTFFLF